VDGQIRRSRFWVEAAARYGKLGLRLPSRTRRSHGADISLLGRLAAGYYN
jgi:hypothetical protein